eukprot:132493-Amphidinium_carterae.1
MQVLLLLDMKFDIVYFVAWEQPSATSQLFPSCAFVTEISVGLPSAACGKQNDPDTDKVQEPLPRFQNICPKTSNPSDSELCAEGSTVLHHLSTAKC